MAHMHTVIELRRDRANLVTKLQEILDRGTNEKRGLTPEENAQADKIIADEVELRGKIERFEKLEDMQRSLDGHENRHAAAAEENKLNPEYRKAFQRFLQVGMHEMTQEERQALQAGYRPLEQEERALAAGTATAGGNTVPTDFYDSLITAMKYFSSFYEDANVIDTTSGNTLLIPTGNDTGNVGRIIGENVAANTNIDPSFGQKSVGSFIYTSDVVLVPVGLLQDSAFDLETWLRDKLAERIARAANAHFTTGTGTGQPEGIVGQAALGKTGIVGQTSTVVYDDLVDLIHSVDIAYRARSKFQFHDNTLKALKKLKDSQGRPLWLPGIAYKEPDLINGYGYSINNDMAQMAAAAKSILFGDFKTYMVRRVRNPIMVRFGEKYMDAFQVGFVLFFRQDGRFISAGVNPVSYYANSAT
ncbi:phage major capsid protein [Paenibacillus alba]|uniref:phage major capsid protein n=1 Tax=Paenibacillus alba TaxID=1197127 RepID=UPI001566F273|nr:phage major capsid protein [Paenibacillus alba]NQX68479.1 phage major capsid protein [Paenibacillus alba]